MKKLLAITSALIITAAITGSPASTASAASKKYSNCKALNKVYPNGVAKTKKAAGSTKARVSSSLYNANKKLDRDKDGIVCEKSTPATTVPTTTVPGSSGSLTSLPIATTIPKSIGVVTQPALPTATTIPGSFGSGTKVIGSGVTAGRYLTTTAKDCYWERLSGFTGSFNEIIANENPSGTHAIVDILSTDRGFNSNRCGTWIPFVPSPPASFGEGTFAVSSEMPAGTWTATFTTSCYWSRLSSFDGSFGSIIANGNPNGSAVVTILPTDVGFLSSRCGIWTKIG
jgi:hypothetical protein